MNNKIIKFLILPISLTLGACTSLPTVSDIVPQIRLPGVDSHAMPTGKGIQQANNYLQEGRRREAASAYFAASKNYRSPERERLILQAAELSAFIKDSELTYRYLAPINYATLNKENKMRYRYSQAQLALNDRNYRETLRILPQRVNGLPVGLAEKILKSRMIAAQSSADKLAIVQELVLQENTLAEPYQIKANNNRIWNHVLLMSKEELDKGRKIIGHTTIKGWLELGYLVNTLKSTKKITPVFRMKLANWQRHHPSHPGNEKAIQLLNYQPAAKTRPYLGTVKPSKS